MAGEFDLIARHFNWPAPPGVLGVGDDCALLPIRPGHRLAVTTDLLVEGRHFFPDVDPETLGHKALAVNVSDLAAMGAAPVGCVLGLSLPTVDDDWLQRFSKGFRSLAEAVRCPLVGGDTTRSPSGIIISVTAMGEVPLQSAMARSAARPGDDLWVTGDLGAAHFALELLQGHHAAHASRLHDVRAALERPAPPVAFGAALAAHAHAAIDISDGFLQDLGHILKASACGAEIHYDRLPVHPGLHGLSPAVVQRAVLNGGDVYQLCFTADPSSRHGIEALALQHGVDATVVGRIVGGEAGLCVHGAPLPVGPDDINGFDHFK